MSVRLRQWRDADGKALETWMIDIAFRRNDGGITRVRKFARVQTRRGAEREELEIRAELKAGTYVPQEEVNDPESKLETSSVPASPPVQPPAVAPPPPQQQQPAPLPVPPVSAPPAPPAVPTVADFCATFVDQYAATNNKLSEWSSKRMICAAYIKPALGHLRLDQVRVREVEAFKAQLLQRPRARGAKNPISRKSINNILGVLSRMLRGAVELELIDKAPAMKRLRLAQQKFDYLDFEEFDRLLAVADGDGAEVRTVILFAGDTGARMGEILALEWSDVDLKKGLVRFERSDWRGNVAGTKTGKVRVVPLTKRLQAALKAQRHLRGARVFCFEDGRPWTIEKMRWILPRACKRAGLRHLGWHVLRHTFASHLAMRGVPLLAIKELGGWATLSMVQRYAHLSPANLRDAVGVLEAPPPGGATAHERHMDGGGRGGEGKTT